MRKLNALSFEVAVAARMCESPVVGPNGGGASGIGVQAGRFLLNHGRLHTTNSRGRC